MPASTEPLFPQPLLDALARRPGRTAIEHGSRVVSCGELLALVRRLVEGMRRAGLGPGRGVATLTAVTPEAFAANVAAHALGCRVAGVRPGWSTPQLDWVLSGGIDAFVGDPATLTPELLGLTGQATVLSLGHHPGAIDLLASADEMLRSCGSSGPRRAQTAARTGVRPITVEAQPDTIARLNFTSGSTGRPKGCARSYRTFSLAYRTDRWAPDLARLVATLDRLLVYGSLSMPVMLTFAGRCLITGGVVVMPDEDQRTLFPDAIQRHRISGVAMTVPSLHGMLARLRDDPVDLRHLRALVVSGSPASPGLLAAATDCLGPVVWQGYGQAESGMVSLLTPEDIARYPGVALESVGRPLPDVEISLRDPDGVSVGAGEIGEICVRSPHLMAGYWRDPRETRDAIRDGWLHTRDLGRLDPATGLLLLTGRSRDVIMVNGEVCYAGAIEGALVRHPDVEQAYVVGVPDQRTGEAVHAFVVLAADRVPDSPALAGLIRSELTAAHVPMTITALQDVPVGAGGKPDKQALAGLVRLCAHGSHNDPVPGDRFGRSAPDRSGQTPPARDH